MRCILCETKLHRVTVGFDFWDLQRGIRELAPRKREALFFNVIRDMKQKDVAREMKITTVTVGQYVEHAFRQLIDRHIIEVDDDA
jgi:DNA-directed RNA polymerase specialized sigma24 family protein